VIPIVLDNSRLPERLRFAARACALWIALCAAASPAGAATYYVDNQSPDASPSGPGTPAQPYATITAAVAAHAGPGTTILVRPGLYREQVSITASGADGDPFVIRAEGPGVVIDGSDDFTGEPQWVGAGDAAASGAHDPRAIDYAWLAAGVTWPPEQVFLNGRRLTPLAVSPEVLPPDAFTWVSGEGLYVNLAGSNPGTQDVAVARRDNAFRVMGSRSWVRIEGFEIRRVNDAGINVFTGCSDIVIARNTISLCERYGIKVAGSTRVEIVGNVVSESNFSGIGVTAGSTACLVRDNESFRNAIPGWRAAKGILLQSSPGNVVAGNRTYENQDTGIQVNAGSDDCILYNNRSWHNGDHGFDHLDVSGTIHLHNVAYGNYKDGFSIEGDSPGSKVFNCIAVDNGLTTEHFDLWVNGLSSIGFESGYNIIWNSDGQEPVKFVTTKYNLLSDYVLDSGQDTHSIQANPLFVDPEAGDFTPRQGSPAIDAGSSNVPYEPSTDYLGHLRFDDPSTPDVGNGPVTFTDIGAVEYVVIPDQGVIELPCPLLPGIARGPAVLGRQAAGAPGSLALSSAFPNPTRGAVEFALDLPRDTRVEWAVFDLQGRVVWSEGRTMAAGRGQLRWDGTAAGGAPAPDGVYLVRARVEEQVLTRRMVRF
jgi:parallel beta-helix repeat protein